MNELSTLHHVFCKSFQMSKLITSFFNPVVLPCSKKSKKLKKKEKLAQEKGILAECERGEAEPLPEVSSEQFFEVKTSLKEVFEKKDEGFSLLSMFGTAMEQGDKAGEGI